MKVAFLIPSTTRKRPWRKMEDTYLYKIFGQSFIHTISNDIEYTIYINIDRNDPIYSKTIEKNKFISLIGEKAKIKFISDGQISRGYITAMWNYLFKLAYDDDNDYFYQCGDDIMFQNIDWLSECIEQLKKQKNIGICGPINPPNYRILTQTLVSRKHWEIFRYYFPPLIKNWWCDDWINYVYYPHYVTKMENLIAENKGGEPRYSRPNIVENNAFRDLCLQLTVQSKRKIKDYLVRS
jgi:hypothetical protein